MITDVVVLSNPVDHTIEFAQEKFVANFLHNKKYIERVKNETFNNLPFNVNLILVKFNLVSHSEINESLHNLFEQAKNKIESQTQIKQNSINLVTKLTGLHTASLGRNKIGSWIICHKLGHGLFESTNIYYSEFGKKNHYIKNSIEKWMQFCYNKLHKTTLSEYNDNLPGWDDVFKELSTFKSAQQCIIRPDNQEYIYELVAQYSMFGKIKFIFPSRIFENDIEARTNALEIENLIHEALTNCVGELIFGD